MTAQRAPVPLEHEIQNSIIDYLRMRQWYVLRLNAGAAVIEQPNGSRRVIRGVPAGVPDLLALKQGERALFIEVKRPGRKPTDRQYEAMHELVSHGASCLVATSVEDVRRAGV